MKNKYLILNSLSQCDFHVRKDIIPFSEEEAKFVIRLMVQNQLILFEISIYSLLISNNYT